MGPLADWFITAHALVPIPKASTFQLLGRPRRTKGGNSKVRTKEFSKAVRPKAQVMKESQADEREVHFGALMELCSIKTSQLEKELWTFKDHIMFEGGHWMRTVGSQ